MTADGLLITDAALPGEDGTVDVLLRGGAVESIVPTGTVAAPAVESVSAEGRWIVPGLWDNHVHFAQWTVQRQRIDLSPTRSAEQCLDVVRAALDEHPDGNTTGGARVLIGYGFQDGVWPDTPTLDAIDRASPRLPVVLVSKDLHCAWLNSPAAALLDVRPDPGSGLLREEEWFGALTGLQDPSTLSTGDYRAAADAAAQRGVVGIVEFENTDNLSLWPARTAAGVDSLRVETSVWPHRLDAAIAAGARTGDVLDERGLVRMGPLKAVVDGSLNTRTAWCWDPYPGLGRDHPHPCGQTTVPLDELEDVMTRARDAGISAAIHAIGDRANTGVLDAFEKLGMTGTIEHAQLVRTTDFDRFGRLGLTASIQPEHAMDDRDVADRHWAGRTDRAFAFSSLAQAGAVIRLGSDAPVAPLDPWISLAAGISRSRDDRPAWHPEQSLDVRTALAASTRGRSAVAAGDAADLVLVERDPLTATAAELRSMRVAATLLGGRFTWRDL
jgi:predicted amidohydrolase YtcJ